MMILHYFSCMITLSLLFYIVWLFIDIAVKNLCQNKLQPFHRKVIGVVISLFIVIRFFTITSIYK